MDTETLDCLKIGPDDATHVFLWLHGLGDSGHGHADVVRMLEFPDGIRAQFVLPHAPRRSVSVNNGAIMPAWYDIRSIGGGQHDIGGIRDAADRVSLFIDRELDRGVPAERIFLCGFSQGGCVALHIALRYPERLGCAVGLSTYMADVASLDAEAAPENADLPVFLGHGLRDPMVPISAMNHAKGKLESLGHEVTCATYPMEHAICPEEVADLGLWLRPRL